ncbi:TauD/TfdA family dioxygenase [Cobetia crustatorum]|uniref:TauD/TfdA family dioxygenase n=1 Tax=Cobetia crustatorum TaxID=553385 RepID=UPI000468EC50|nr:TauD/TfdA family dioxygenase [Cobetia crustatorum]
MSLPKTPDYDSWPIDETLVSVSHEARQLSVTWSDGRVSRYHSVWLRENAADDSTINPATRERILDLSLIPAWPEIAEASIDDKGALSVLFTPEDRRLRFHPGFLRANDYDNQQLLPSELPPVSLWNGEQLQQPPTIDAATLAGAEHGSKEEADILNPTLHELLGKGLVRLRNLPAEEGAIEKVAERIGSIRSTNFGHLFNVRAIQNPDSNAYTSIALPPHVDLPTREYQPGLQCLYCIENSVKGGMAVMMDGFAIATAMKEEHPEAYATLTTIHWRYANTSRNTDHVWYSPMIVLGQAGELLEVRIADFLRGPMTAPFDQTETAYEALMTLQRMLREPRFAMRFTYTPGDMVIFDNRRLLHARDAFEGESGSRWLQGCYLERDEVRSRYRMLKRDERTQRVTEQNDVRADSESLA